MNIYIQKIHNIKFIISLKIRPSIYEYKDFEYIDHKGESTNAEKENLQLR